MLVFTFPVHLLQERKQIEVGRPSAESLQTSLNNMILRCVFPGRAECAPAVAVQSLHSCIADLTLPLVARSPRRLDSLYSVSVADKNGLVLAAAASASAPAAALPTLQAAGDTGGSVSSPRAGGSAFAPSATAAGVLTVSGPSVDSMVLAFLASTEQASKLFAGSSTTITT